MANITVLGAGTVGSAIAADLSRRHKVIAIDRSTRALDRLPQAVGKVRSDLSERANLLEAASEADLLVCAVPGFMGFNTLTNLLKARTPIVDISYMAEDPSVLDLLASQRGVPVVVDMGLAPGMPNLILGHHDATMEVDRFEVLVGGLPLERSWPFAFKATFSPSDVIEAYTRPARLVREGRRITLPALSEPELVEFPGIGTLEAFNTDGLRSLLTTMGHIPELSAKALRYPGHRDQVAALVAAGFFDTEPKRIQGAVIRPRDATTTILLDHWKHEPGEPERTVMRVRIEGKQDGHHVTHTYALHDQSAPNATPSMARTTGYAATAMVEWILTNPIEPGLHAPERLGAQPGCLEHVLAYQAQRGVHYAHLAGKR